MHLRRLAILSLALFCAVPASAQDEAFLGKWDITGVAPHETHVYWLEVKNEGGTITGSFLNRGGSVFKLQEISVKDGELVFSFGRQNGPKITHRARVVDGKLMGTAATEKETIKWVGVRAPKWGKHDANARHQMGAPVELFDGKSLDNWDIQFKNKPSGWSVVDGAMTNSPGANNLISKQKFMNFKIHAEYKLEPKSNSGIYLRGRYELQVLDDHGKEPESHGHMAIYSRVQPAFNASLPPGEWQTMEAIIVGNRVTVTLNGKTVHNNALLEGITGGALDSREAESGPIMLQGDHGKVWFRKITITPITK